MTDSDELLAIRAAELYYDDDKTQDEIGTLLRLTRWKVGRLLAQAKARGFIRIEIVHPRARKLQLERALRERFGLADAIVIPVADARDDEEIQARCAQAAADYLASRRPAPRVLGVSWGRTLHEVAQRLPSGWAPHVDVVQINGGVSLNKRAGMAESTAVAIARKANGTVRLLPSPAILERVETKRSIERDRAVAGVLNFARTASVYLYSAGVVTEDSAHVDSGYLTPSDIEALKRKGAVGDVVGRYINAAGEIVDSELDQRTLGLSLDQLRRAATGIAVIAGRPKHEIARAVVTNGLCTVLVTDEATALTLLAELDPSPSQPHQQ
ncbi:MAG: sugar-binding transcriptional regulator [Microbacteriaceae bacterium]